jgi:hypothetical protein
MILTNFINEIKTGDYNLIIFIMCLFLLYYTYNHILTCKNKIENMTNASNSQINEAVKRYLINTDEFIRNITDRANQIQRNGLQINGDLVVTGLIRATGEISNNQFSLTRLNNRINSGNQAATPPPAPKPPAPTAQCGGPTIRGNCPRSHDPVRCPNGKTYSNSCAASLAGCSNCPRTR